MWGQNKKNQITNLINDDESGINEKNGKHQFTQDKSLKKFVRVRECSACPTPYAQTRMYVRVYERTPEKYGIH